SVWDPRPRRPARLLDDRTVCPRREAAPSERDHRRADVYPVVARRRGEMIAQQTLGDAPRPDPELEDGMCTLEVGVRDQIGGGVILVEPLRVLPASDPVIEGSRGRVIERRPFGHAGPSAWAIPHSLGD